MAHGDNRGLKLPPKIAPVQVVIVPVAANKEGVLEKATELKNRLSNFRVELDDRMQYTPGYKFNYWELKGVPIRIEIGPRDIENNKCVIVRRDTFEKIDCSLDNLENEVSKLLDEIQQNMFDMCKANMEKRTNVAHNMTEFKEALDKNQGFVKAMFCGDPECEEKIHQETMAKSRCIPFEEEHIDDKCVYCGRPAKHMVYWARQY